MDGWPIAEAWLASTPEDRHHLLYDALFAIVEGTWPSAYRHYDDVTARWPHGVILQISAEEVLVFRVYTEYPNWFRLIYIGKIDY